MPLPLSARAIPPSRSPSGGAELVADGEHFTRIVRQGILTARTSLDILTADFEAMLVPEPVTRRARSIVEVFRRLADRGEPTLATRERYTSARRGGGPQAGD